MKPSTLLAAVSLMLLGSTVLPAQETTTYVFGAYYTCNQAQEARTDTIYREVIAPLMQKHVDAGHYNAIGWSKHWAGGEWRRLRYMVGTDMDDILAAREAYIEEVTSQHADAVEEFNEICPSHDDYIWTVTAQSTTSDEVGQNRPDAGMSSYMVCDSREALADEIFEAALAPVLNRHMEEGVINSWAWLSHLVGGKYRKVLVYDGTDYGTVLNYWNQFWGDVDEESPELLAVFSEICDSHTDYVWDLTDSQ